jgi:hypothetical protein
MMLVKEIAEIMSLPMYILTHPNMRESLGIPFLHVGKQIRFKLDEIKAWMLRCSAEMEAHGGSARHRSAEGFTRPAAYIA